MEMYKLKFTRLQNEIFRLLCIKADMPLNQREISKKLKVSPTAINKSLHLLERQGLIISEKVKNMNLKYIKLNRENQKTTQFKRIENLKLIYDSGLVGFLEESFPGSAIILFGSYSKGEDTINSDIDIAIIGSRKKEINFKKFENLLERRFFLHIYSSFGKIEKELKENLFSGILLAGAIRL